MKKFKALSCAMAVLAVVLFVSAAFAADPTTFVYSTSNGQLGFLAVGESSVSVKDPVEISKFNDDGATKKIKLFTSDDKTAFAGGTNAFYQVVASADGSPAISGDKISGYELGAVNAIGVSGDFTLIAGKSGVASVDLANWKAYDATSMFNSLNSLSKDLKAICSITSDGVKALLAADGSSIAVFLTASRDVDKLNENSTASTSEYGLIAKVKDGLVYAASANGLVQVTGIKSSDKKIKGIEISDKIITAKVAGLAADTKNEKLYVLQADGKVLSLVSADKSSSNKVESADLGKISTTIAETKVSLDMAVYGDLLTVIDDNGLCVYKIGTSSVDLVGSSDKVVSIAKLATTASFDIKDDTDNTDNKDATEDSTTGLTKGTAEKVTFADLADELQEALKTVTDGVEPASYAPAELDSSVTSADINSALGDSAFTSNVVTFGTITPTEAGFVVQKASVAKAFELSKFKFFFVRLALLVADSPAAEVSLAAEGDAVEAKLYNADGEELKEGTLAADTEFYAVSSSELKAEEYAMVAGAVETGDDGTDGTDGTDGNSSTGKRSSSSGCNAGFAAVSALLALAFIKKSR